jgi:cation-transporting ATPase 13A1
MKELYEKQVAMMKRFNQPQPPVPLNIAHLYPPGPTNPNYEKAMERQTEIKKARLGITDEKKPEENGKIETITTPGAAALKASEKKDAANKKKTAQEAWAGQVNNWTTSLMEGDLDDSEPPTIKLGDASVAAPFTSKLANVIAIPNIIRQGRCTLVATIQMYKILALNCLISAYSLSVLYLDGIKFGDGQVTISGMMMSVCFLSISRARVGPLLSPPRHLETTTNILCAPACRATLQRAPPK